MMPVELPTRARRQDFHRRMYLSSAAYRNSDLLFLTCFSAQSRLIRCPASPWKKPVIPINIITHPKFAVTRENLRRLNVYPRFYYYFFSLRLRNDRQRELRVSISLIIELYVDNRNSFTRFYSRTVHLIFYSFVNLGRDSMMHIAHPLASLSRCPQGRPLL